jgi:uridine kinase
MTIQEIADSIKKLNKPTGPVLIAIEGFGGSGKTTIANKLSSALGNAYVVNIDDFIVKEKINEPSWDKGGFDRARLEQQVLLPASRQEPVHYQELVWESNQLSKPKVMPQIHYLIVEGISCYHPDIAHYYDFKLWIDTPIEVAKARGQARDGSNENADMWDLWAENDIRYREKYHPEQQADFIINNSN